MKNYFCFDIGGTFIKFGIINEIGELLFKDMVRTPKNNNSENIPNLLCDIVKKNNKYPIDAIGVSTAGIVDSENGKIIYASSNIPEYTGTEISKKIVCDLGIECFVENDVNAAALGELWLGSAMGLSNFVCITVGTGIGTAIVINKKIYRGSNNFASFGGHIIINESGRACNCGSNGCYEQYASTSALIKMYKESAGDNSLDIDGKFIFSKIKDSDDVAINIFNEYIEHLVTGLLNLTYILDPGTIIIGGGISEEKSFFLESIQEKYRKRCLYPFVERTIIKSTKLGNDAGMYGAAWTCKNSYISQNNK